MALINCSECGHQVSTRALACPSCGCPPDSIENTSAVDNNQEVDILLSSISPDESKYEIYESLEKLSRLFRLGYDFKEEPIPMPTTVLKAVLSVALFHPNYNSRDTAKGLFRWKNQYKEIEDLIYEFVEENIDLYLKGKADYKGLHFKNIGGRLVRMKPNRNAPPNPNAARVKSKRSYIFYSAVSDFKMNKEIGHSLMEKIAWLEAKLNHGL